MTDPNQLFVTNAIKRSDIAESLNDYLECNGCITEDRLKPDDVRLTDAICEKYAKLVGDVDEEEMTEEMIDEAFTAIDLNTLIEIGIDPSVEDGEE